MGTDDRSRTLRRYVAGMEVPDGELLRAAAAIALDDRARAVGAALRALCDDEDVIRLRAVRRLADPVAASPFVSTALTEVVRSDHDERVRGAAAAVLAAHHDIAALAELCCSLDAHDAALPREQVAELVAGLARMSGDTLVHALAESWPATSAGRRLALELADAKPLAVRRPVGDGTLPEPGDSADPDGLRAVIRPAADGTATLRIPGIDPAVGAVLVAGDPAGSRAPVLLERTFGGDDFTLDAEQDAAVRAQPRGSLRVVGTGLRSGALPLRVVATPIDAGGWLIVAQPAGPAGAVATELLPGLRAAFDAAEPSRLLELDIAVDGTQTAQPLLDAVAALLGDGAAAALGDAALGADPPTTLRLRTDAATAGTIAGVGRLALLDTLRAGDAGSPLPGGPDDSLWSAEAAMLAARADPRLLLGARAAADAPGGARALLARGERARAEDPRSAPGDEDAAGTAPPLAEVAAEVAGVLESSDPETAGRLRAFAWPLPPAPPGELDDRDLARLFEPPAVERVEAAALRAVSTTRAAPGDVVEVAVELSRALVDSGRLPAEIAKVPGWGRIICNRGTTAADVPAPGRRGSWTLEAGEMIVLVPLLRRAQPDDARRISVRLCDPCGEVLASTALSVDELAPGWGVGRLESAAPARPEELEVELVGDIGLPYAGSLGTTYVAARRTGMRAAQAVRLGHFGRACGLWRTCAAYWERAGDPDRHALALAHAAATAAKVADPELAGELREEVSTLGPRCAWAGDRLRAPLVPGSAYLEEAYNDDGRDDRRCTG